MQNTLIVVYHPAYLEHDTGPGHPESPERLRSINKLLNEEGYFDKIPVVTPQPASTDSIATNHSMSYIESIGELCASGGGTVDQGDTVVSGESIRAALLAAGAGLTAVDKIEGGEALRAFCMVRPPGHHAERDRAMGFCLFNNIAITARHWLEKLEERRVCIVDWDVHHGNGTQNAFYSDAEVQVISLHQMPLYPGTGNARERGEGRGEGFNLNIPISPGTSGEEYLKIFRSKVIPEILSYKPSGILISAGFDAHRDDPLANLALTENTYRTLTRELVDISRDLTGGKIISFLEGGYNLDVLPKCVAAHLEEMS